MTAKSLLEPVPGVWPNLSLCRLPGLAVHREDTSCVKGHPEKPRPQLAPDPRDERSFDLNGSP